VATIVGKTSPFIARPFLTRDQIIVLRFIRDSFPERGLYFTTGPTAHELGLTPYLLRQGLVDKLVPRPAGLTPGAVPVEGVGWVDAERTVALWRDVYTAPESLLTFGRWVDEASNTIPRMYAATGFLTSRVLASSGQGAESDSVLATVRDIVAILGLE
jgi:hypothetical protein